jgi:iron complex outermembrane receptor protein
MNINAPQTNLSGVSHLIQCGLAALGLLLCLGPTAQAQDEAEELMLEEVIVTAEKREVNVQDVTMSVNVITSDFLEENSLTDMTEMLAYTPSVTYSGAGSMGTVSMRGIGTNTFGTAEPTVSFVMDGVPLQSQSQGLTDLVDIERIEVLRGPQSTLFGKNASAGVISIVTRGPGDEFESWFKALVTDDGEYNLIATISGPMSDSVGGLLTAFYKQRDGNVYNHYSDSWVNDSQSQGLRARMDWQASDDVSISFIGNYREEDNICCAGVLIDPAIVGPNQMAEIYPVVPNYTNAEINQDVLPLMGSDTWSLQATVNWDIGDYTLTSITSYNDYEATFQLDMDGSPAETPYFSDLSLIGWQTGSGGSQTFSQEVRFESPLGGNFDYLLGMFYYDFESSNDFDRLWDICFAPPFIPGTTCGFIFTFPQGNRGLSGSSSTSLFAHGNYHFSDRLRLVGGLRVMYEKISYDFERISPTGLIFGPSYHNSDSHSKTVPMGDISLQYDLNESSMVYGKYTRGYKGQAYGLSSSFNDEQAAEQPVDGETVDSFELGYKSMLAGGRVRLNAALFHMTYNDYQAQAAVLDPAGNTEFRLINAGSIESKGLEVDFQALLTESLTLTGAVTFLDAEFTDFDGAPCWSGQPEGTGSGFCEDGVQDLAGFPLPAAPDLKYNVSLRYDFQTGARFVPYLQGSYVYVDEQTFALDQDPLGYEPSHGLWHASAGLTDSTGRYLISAFVRNIGNETYYTSHDFGTAQRPRDIERYYGLNFRVNF